MRVQTSKLLLNAQKEKYAIGAFNVYNLEGIQAVINAAEGLASPVILQVLPSALQIFGTPLIAACVMAAQSSDVPVCVHLDHCSCVKTILLALETGVSSIMADGSHLSFEKNIEFTKDILSLAKKYSADVEAELGFLGGEEDGISQDKYLASLTDPDQAKNFIEITKADFLAVCIGNRHGKYKILPDLDFGRLKAIADQTPAPLVLHGASGLPDRMILKSMEYGVCKFNVNTEIRSQYISTLKDVLCNEKNTELIQVMNACVKDMTGVIESKIKLFGSENKAF